MQLSVFDISTCFIFILPYTISFNKKHPKTNFFDPDSPQCKFILLIGVHSSPEPIERTLIFSAIKPFQLCFPACVSGWDSASFKFPCVLSERRIHLIRKRNSVMLTVNASSPHSKVNYRVKTCWNQFKAPWRFLFESTGAAAGEIGPNIATFIEWWCMGNNLKAI